jgi:hypothetical protein
MKIKKIIYILILSIIFLISCDSTPVIEEIEVVNINAEAIEYIWARRAERLKNADGEN